MDQIYLLQDMPDDFNHDDLLNMPLQIFFTAYDTTLKPQEIINDVLDLYKSIESYPETTTN